VAAALGVAADPVTFELAAGTRAGTERTRPVVLALRAREDAVAVRRQER